MLLLEALLQGLIAAYMYMGSKTDEERSYYDWMGFVGNMIGVGALLLLPFMGYLLAYELCDYDASICPYMMADQLSMFFEMQGAMIGLIFLASNYYIWLSLKRIEGVEQIRMSGFVALAVLFMPAIMGLPGRCSPHLNGNHLFSWRLLSLLQCNLRKSARSEKLYGFCIYHD